ncbi:MAG: hypothetical protein JST55_14450 [Bacteroidetes bacterium]|nr:hypothetical protein [Bacteroidota bacterium]
MDQAKKNKHIKQKNNLHQDKSTHKAKLYEKKHQAKKNNKHQTKKNKPIQAYDIKLSGHPPRQNQNKPKIPTQTHPDPKLTKNPVFHPIICSKNSKINSTLHNLEINKRFNNYLYSLSKFSRNFCKIKKARFH